MAPMRNGGFVRRLAQDTCGNTLAIVAAAVFPMLALVGGGVDISRAYMAKTQLQSACDAAVLAGRRAMAASGTFGESERTTANTMFDFNFDSGSVGAREVSFEAQDNDKGQLFGNASAIMPTAVMYFFGFTEIPLQSECMAELQLANVDVMFVLDTTGSMSGSRISALRAAVRDFHATIADAVTEAETRVRYGFVPYSTTVNAKQLLNDGVLSSSLFRNRTPYQTRVAVFDNYDYVLRNKTYLGGDTYTNSDNYWNCWDSWTETSGRKPNDVTVAEYQESYYAGSCRVTRQRYRYTYENRRAYHFSRWIYKQAELDTTRFKAFNSVSVATDLDPELSYVDSRSEYTVEELAKLSIRGMNTSRSTWNGCLQERDTVQTGNFDPVPDEAYDLDIPLIPHNDATRWSPIWPDVSWRRSPGRVQTDSGDKTTSYPCPAPMLPFQEIDISSGTVPGWLGTYLDSLNATGNTYHDVGMIWGARLGSSRGVVAANVNAGDKDNVSRHLLFMTDGQLEPHSQSFTAYGVEHNDNRIAPANANNNTLTTRHYQRFRVACDRAKAEGYTIYVVAFGTSINEHMRYCATGGRYYESGNTTELRNTFKYIASQVADLRLGQ